MLQKATSRQSQCHLLTRPFEQNGTEFALEFANLQAERRLTDSQALGCAPEM
jgi:hypothetical protein